MRTKPFGGGAGSEPRGQTSVDLVVGLGLFIVTITVVLGQLPPLLGPAQPQAAPAVADRAAEELYGELAVRDDSARSGALDEPCVVAFFSGSGGGDCPFDPSNSVNDRLGITPLYGVNVSFAHGNGSAELEPYCRDDGEVVVCGTDRLTAGPSVPSDASVAVTYRGAQVRDRNGVLIVRVWRR